MDPGRTPPAPERRETIAYLALTGVVFAYVVVRAASVPWVHDECTSLYWFAERGRFLPYHALWDAGNHFLSSAIGAAGHALWGLSLFGSRIGSVVAFVLYAWAVHRLGSHVHGSLARRVLWAALLLCPLLLDFFSLFRGYGPAMAFWVLALDGLLRWARGREARHLVQPLVALALANASVPTTVPLWAVVVAATGVWLLRAKDLPARWRALATWGLLGVLPLCAGLLIAWELKRRGLLYHGSLEGFVPVTVGSLVRHVTGFDGPGLRAAIVALAVLAALAVPLLRAWRGPLAVLAGLLWAEVVLRLAMAHILAVHFPEDRAALHLVPLFIAGLVVAADAWTPRWQPARVLPLMLLALPLRTIALINTDRTLLWPEQSVPLRFLQRISELQVKGDRPLAIGAYHQLDFALPYAARLHGLPLNPPDVDFFPHGPHDVRIVDRRHLAEALPGYSIIDSAANGLWLLHRDRPLDTERLAAFIAGPFPAPSGRVDLWHTDDSVHSHIDVFLEMRFTVRSPDRFTDLDVVVDAWRGDERLFIRRYPLALRRARWNGEQMHILVRVPGIPGADLRTMYLWVPRGTTASIGGVETATRKAE